MTEHETPETTFDQLDLKTQIWALLSYPSEVDMQLKTALAILGYDPSMTGPNSIDLEAIDAALVAEIEAYMEEFRGLSQDEVERIMTLHGKMAENAIDDYYDRLFEHEESR